MRTSYGLAPVALVVAAAGAVWAAPPLAPTGKVALTADFKLVEGEIGATDTAVTVRQGSFSKTLPRAAVLFVGESRADAYRFRLSQLDPADHTARLALARWCALNGMRGNALAEARATSQAEPTNRPAAEMARSLEASLRQFPEPGTVAPPSAAAAEPESDVTPEALAAFGNRVQPVLVNLCAGCHARPDHAGGFRLARTPAADAGPLVTRQNLRAVLTQLRKDDPSASPVLVKALSAHGGMPIPLFSSRQAAAYKTLELWVYSVVAPTVLPPMDATPMAAPVAKLPPAPAPLTPDAIPAGGSKPALPPVEPPAAKPGPLTPDAIPTAPAKLPPAGGFGADAKPVLPTAPKPTGDGPAADEFDPAVFNRAANSPRK